MTTPVSTSTRGRAAMAVIPLVLVNGISVVAQYEFWRGHLPGWPPLAAALLGVALESIAIYVGYHAHLALMADRSSFRLRMASYAIGAIIGVLNGSHYLAHGHVTAASIGIGLLSASSPWLWGLHSRRESQDALMAKGVLEGHALRIGATRFMFHPVRSLRVMSAAAWTGTTDIHEALAMVEPHANAALAAIDFEPERLSDQRALADAIRFAMAEIARARNVDIAALSAREIADWLTTRADQLAEPWNITTSYVSDVLRRTLAARERAAGSNVTQISRGRHSA